MEIVFVAIISMIAGFISLFSGFGVSLAMLPLLLIYFPAAIAIAIAAFLSLINNCFKLSLFKSMINRQILLFFGVPAAITSFIGAHTLLTLSKNNIPFSYDFVSFHFSTSTFKITIGILILLFVIIEIIHKFKVFQPHKISISISGFIAGFIGGISGYQGGFQAAILLKLNMPLRQFIATYAAITILIDIPRIIVYINIIDNHILNSFEKWALAATTAVSIMTGTYIAHRYTEKITLDIIRFLIIFITIITGLGLITGKV